MPEIKKNPTVEDDLDDDFLDGEPFHLNDSGTPHSFPLITFLSMVTSNTSLPYFVSFSSNKGALDGFTSAKPASPVKPTTTQKAEGTTTSSASSSTSPKAARTPESLLLHPEENEDDELDAGGLDAEFSKQLASGMEELMKEMSGNSELQKSFEEMFKGLDVNGKAPAVAAGAGAASAPATGGASKGAGSASFQDRIAKTMDKLKDSSDQVDVSVLEQNKQNTSLSNRIV